MKLYSLKRTFHQVPGYYFRAMLLLVPMFCGKLVAAPELAVECVVVPPLTMKVSAKDREAEQDFCKINLADASTAICPKSSRAPVRGGVHTLSRMSYLNPEQ